MQNSKFYEQIGGNLFDIGLGKKFLDLAKCKNKLLLCENICKLTYLTMNKHAKYKKNSQNSTIIKQTIHLEQGRSHKEQFP